ncbi:hypothetical protein FWK35_00005267 [Aphis craccivora]|uniref:Uncharacterized protein n=1 Tax=Aphis craccivora TaxID=307492 RepID=A0A6G0ZMT6_APHCR|nr:hypothetical protein FWK35_00005267 [Aphis craccivora]
MGKNIQAVFSDPSYDGVPTPCKKSYIRETKTRAQETVKSSRRLGISMTLKGRS